MMRQKQGSIINMASVVGVHGNAGQCNYSASKAGMIGLAKSIAQELGSNIGGRVFFVRSDIDSESVIEYLESAPVLVQRR